MDTEKDGANGQQGEAAASPAEENKPEGGAEQEATTSAETIKTEAKVPPFNEMMRVPEFQDFFNRQVENAVSRAIAANAQAGLTQAQKKDILDEFAESLVQDYQMDLKQAKRLASQFDALTKHRIDSTVGGLRKENEEMKITLQFGQVFNQYPDAVKYSRNMKQVFEGMSEYDREFVLKSPNGPEFLYQKAKKLADGGVLSNDQKHLGSSPAAKSGASSTRQLDSSASLVGKVSDALVKGDKKAYEQEFARLTNRR